MKVLQINAVHKIGSTGRLCTEISDYLNDSGQEGYMAYASGPTYSNGYKIGTKFDRKVHGFLSRIFGLQAYFSYISTKKLLHYIKTIKPEVVHLHNLHSNYIHLKSLLNYLAKNNIPTVVTLHDCWFYTGKCTHYTIDDCYKWQTGCGSCPRLKKDNPSFFLDRTKKMYNDKKEWFGNIPRLAVIGVSDWITGEAKKSLLSTANIMKRIYNWIDLETFKPVPTQTLRKQLKLEGKFIVLGVASGWSDQKGLSSFVELANLISSGMIIILIGKMNHIDNLPQSIIHIKETHDASELADYYSLADVFLNLSLEESFGKVTAEALACGTPVVAVDSTANSELIGEGCGYLLDSTETFILMDAIEKVKINTKHSYSKQCVEYARNNFNKYDRLNDHMNLYRQLVTM